MSFDQLMARMAQDEVPETNLSDTQIVNRLRECLAKKGEVNKFSRGDVIGHKFPSNSNVRDGGRPHIFLEYLDTPLMCFEGVTEPSKYSSSAAGLVYDCRIAGLSGETFVVWLHDSRDWQRHPDFKD